MEQPNNLNIAKLKKVVEVIFAGGEKAVEEFDYAAYTNEELEYIMNEMHGQTLKEIEGLIEIADECEKEENEAPEKTN
ncbi:MAG: hypothetical protein LBK83_14205 [Treponema sp.]|nr:hypothetical protein [Treponema sp.]